MYNTSITCEIEKHPRTDREGWTESVKDDASKTDATAEPNVLLGFLHRLIVTFQTLFTPDEGGETIPVGMPVPIALIGWKVKRRGTGIQLVPATRPFVIRDEHGNPRLDDEGNEMTRNERTMKFLIEDQFDAICRGVNLLDEIKLAWTKSDYVLEQRAAHFQRVRYAPDTTSVGASAPVGNAVNEAALANAIELITQGDPTKIALVGAALGLGTPAGATPPVVPNVPNAPVKVSGGVIVGV